MKLACGKKYRSKVEAVADCIKENGGVVLTQYVQNNGHLRLSFSLNGKESFVAIKVSGFHYEQATHKAVCETRRKIRELKERKS